ncbi:HesA/MoeB/ThiF family protein [Cytobacillus sp. IB215665]|uniref:HesA/MoeB/ThiF family protein n=1 Tax=Cytobacillus sp. IB215665 TaxID=3097357 RepID=UPI002A133246|nr:HesA/MoeB/ThiF family protein [Cytobacillus sp. IB215665]MDX8367007.1 HesA/MoeB/ThiF family protein [Cytobacillus sp. IB215665]
MSFIEPILTDEEVERYSRQLLLREIGVKGQEKLKKSSVLVIGAGGLGSPALLYLAGAGVGSIGIIDGDNIDLSNLHRQIIYNTEDIGSSKSEAAAERIKKINPGIDVKPYHNYITMENASLIIQDFDVVINGTDNFSTRYLVNDTCVKLGIPLVDASAVMYEGQVAVYMPNNGCYRCLYPNPPEGKNAPSCSNSGVFGALVGIMGSIQAMEALKVLLNIGHIYDSRLIYFNSLTGNFQTLLRKPNPNCPICSNNISKDLKYAEECDIVENKQPFELDNEVKHYEVKPLELNVLKKDKSSYKVIDIRDRDMFNRGHIEGAILVDETNLPQKIEELKSQYNLIIVCQFGKISKHIQKEYNDIGIKNIWSLDGGIINWERYNLPLVKLDKTYS